MGLNRIKAVIKKPGEEYGQMTEISNRLEELQDIVEGHIEVQRYGNLIFICNEEGKLRGLEMNIPFGYDILVGNIIVCGADGEDFSDIPISFAEWKETVDHLWDKGVF